MNLPKFLFRAREALIYTFIVLVAMEVIAAHALAYLYVRNFKLSVKPVTTVEAVQYVSPIVEIKK